MKAFFINPFYLIIISAKRIKNQASNPPDTAKARGTYNTNTDIKMVEL